MGTTDMAATVFEQCFAIIVGHEGAYDTNPADPGNWTGGAIGLGRLQGTNWGISAATYPNLAIADLKLADAQTIYRSDYWDRLHASDLPPALALLVFDAGVNNGVGQASRWLQTAVGARADGMIGPDTLAALRTAINPDPLPICSEFQAQRLFAMASLKDWRVFGLGWARRLCQLPYQSLKVESANV